MTYSYKTLFFTNLLIFCLLTFAAEKYFMWTAPERSAPQAGRYITYRQHPPHLHTEITPPDHALSYADNLQVKPYSLETDANGFIASPYNHANPELTLLFLGGSTTENLFVEAENRFPYEVGRLLTENGRDTNSYNGGFSGNHSLHSLNILLNKGIAIEPDIAILMHNINDAVVLMYQEDYRAEAFRPLIMTEESPTAIDQIKVGFAGARELLIPNLSREIGHLWTQLRPPNPDEFADGRDLSIIIDEESFNTQFAINLQIFIDICRAHQIEPVLMTQPSRFTAEPEPYLIDFLNDSNRQEIYPQLASLHRSFNETIREVGRANEAIVIDLAPQIPQDATHLYDIVHLTDTGSLLAADIIYQEIDSQLSSSQ